MQAMLQAKHRVNHATQGEGESGECRGAASCIQSNMSVRPSVDPQAGSHRAPIRSKVTLTSSDMACWPLWQDLFRRQIMPLALSRIRSELAATCRHARMLRDAATQGSIRRSSRQPRCTESRQPAAAHLKRSEGGHARPTRALRVVVCDSLTRSDSGCGASAHVCRGQTDAPRGITHRISTYFMPQVLLASRRPSSPPATVAGCIQRRRTEPSIPTVD
jgi:hypothetical protein